MAIQLFNPSKDPVPNRRYGDKPVDGVSTITHLGNDYGWGNGYGVYAAADGEVQSIAWVANRKTNNRSGGYGNNITLSHGGGYTTLYAHLPNTEPLVNVGDKVKAGQQIAVMGNTGNAAGIHLHFELRLNGKIIDPNPYLSSGTITPADGGDKIPVTGGLTMTEYTDLKADIAALRVDLFNKVEGSRSDSVSRLDNRVIPALQRLEADLAVRGDASKKQVEAARTDIVVRQDRDQTPTLQRIETVVRSVEGSLKAIPVAQVSNTVELDTDALVAAIVAALPKGSTVAPLSDSDVAKIVQAVNDDAAKRLSA